MVKCTILLLCRRPYFVTNVPLHYSPYFFFRRAAQNAFLDMDCPCSIYRIGREEKIAKRRSLVTHTSCTIHFL